MKIILYSTHCPKCSVVEKKLKEKNIPYEECNDIDIMLSKGFDSMPVLEVNGKILNFKEIVDWIKEQ